MVFEIGLMIDVKLLIMDLRSSSPLKFPMEENSTALERTVICQPIHSLGCTFLMNFEDVSLPLALSGFTKDSDTLESLQANLERHGEDSDPDLCAVAAEPTVNVPWIYTPNGPHVYLRVMMIASI